MLLIVELDNRVNRIICQVGELLDRSLDRLARCLLHLQSGRRDKLQLVARELPRVYDGLQRTSRIMLRATDARQALSEVLQLRTGSSGIVPRRNQRLIIGVGFLLAFNEADSYQRKSCDNCRYSNSNAAECKRQQSALVCQGERCLVEATPISVSDVSTQAPKLATSHGAV